MAARPRRPRPDASTHNPTPEERDERVGPFDVDPEEALAAIVKVDPKDEPVKSSARPIDRSEVD